MYIWIRIKFRHKLLLLIDIRIIGRHRAFHGQMLFFFFVFSWIQFSLVWIYIVHFYSTWNCMKCSEITGNTGDQHNHQITICSTVTRLVTQSKWIVHFYTSSLVLTYIIWVHEILSVSIPIPICIKYVRYEYWIWMYTMPKFVWYFIDID